MQLVENGLDAVVVSELSRLARPDSFESLAVLDIFARNRCLVIANGQTIDFSNPDSCLTGGIQALIDGHYRKNLLRLVHNAKEIGRRRGWHTASRKALPLGISWDKAARWFHCNDDIHRVIEAFRLADEEDLCLWAIGKRTGIGASNVRGILENETYIGWCVYQYPRDPLTKRTTADGRQGWKPKIARSAEEVIRVRVLEENACPVSPERFARVQAKLSEVQRRHATSNAVRHPSRCTTIGRCGSCAEHLYVTANGKKRPGGDNFGYYLCKSHHPNYAAKLNLCANKGWVRRERLDELLIAFCQKTLTNPELLASIIEASMRWTAEIVHPFPGPTKDEALAKLRKKDARLVEMCETEAITIDEFRTRRAKLREEMQRLEQTIEQACHDAPGLSLEDLARLVARAAIRFSALRDGQEQKQILVQLFEEVYFRGESITAFRFSRKFLAELGGSGIGGETVQLETPFRLPAPLQRVPEGHKRCVGCGDILPTKEFYPRRAKCRPCFRKNYNALRSARSAKKKAAATGAV